MVRSISPGEDLLWQNTPSPYYQPDGSTHHLSLKLLLPFHLWTQGLMEEVTIPGLQTLQVHRAVCHSQAMQSRFNRPRIRPTYLRERNFFTNLKKQFYAHNTV